MGDETGNHQSAGVAAGKAALLARSSIWKSAIVIAPLAATALFLASGTQAQTSGSAPSSASASSSGPVAPIETAAAARRKGPKVKVKEAMDTSRVANPPTTTEPVAQPETARTGRPKERDPTPTNDRVAIPPTTTEPVAQPAERKEGPKGDSGSGRTSTTPLIIGALGAATVLALVVSGGNDRPTSP